MIRKTLGTTQAATWSILLPDREQAGLPIPSATGFFVSPDGWFVTAAHVVTENNQSDGPVRKDIGQFWLMRERRGDQWGNPLCQYLDVDVLLSDLDFALLKADFQRNCRKDWLRGQSEFSFLTVSCRELDEAEPVYAFGYPLSMGGLVIDTDVMKFGMSKLSPRVTAAIVSSTVEATEMVSSPSSLRVYVLDRALNYGNSGGPIVATATGHPAAFCSRFQPMHVPQPYLKDEQGKPLYIQIPSLYSVVVSLANEAIIDELKKRKVPIADD